MSQVEISTKNLIFVIDSKNENFQQHFNITNFSSELKVCFKIKSTSNKKFLVNPFTGVVNKSDETRINVTLKTHGID